MGIEGPGDCGHEMGVETGVCRPVEWQDRLQQGEFDCGRVEPAVENIRKCVGLDRRAAHRARNEGGRVWRDVDWKHRGNGNGRRGKWGGVEFSFACGPVERCRPGPLGRAEGAAKLVAAALAPVAWRSGAERAGE